MQQSSLLRHIYDSTVSSATPIASYASGEALTVLPTLSCAYPSRHETLTVRVVPVPGHVHVFDAASGERIGA